jgi:hypothetical protein
MRNTRRVRASRRSGAGARRPPIPSLSPMVAPLWGKGDPLCCIPAGAHPVDPRDLPTLVGPRGRCSGAAGRCIHGSLPAPIRRSGKMGAGRRRVGGLRPLPVAPRSAAPTVPVLAKQLEQLSPYHLARPRRSLPAGELRRRTWLPKSRPVRAVPFQLRRGAVQAFATGGQRFTIGRKETPSSRAPLSARPPAPRCE